MKFLILILSIFSSTLWGSSISLSPGITDIFVHLGLAKKLIATDFHYVLPNTPSVGNSFSINLEKIISLNPKRIYFEKIKSTREIEKLRKAKLTVIEVDLTNIKGLQNAIKTIGRLEGIKSIPKLSEGMVPKIKIQTLIIFSWERKLNQITRLNALTSNSLQGEILNGVGIELANDKKVFLTPENYEVFRDIKKIFLISNNHKDKEILKKRFPNSIFIKKEKLDLFNGPSSYSFVRKIHDNLSQ